MRPTPQLTARDYTRSGDDTGSHPIDHVSPIAMFRSSDAIAAATTGPFIVNVVWLGISGQERHGRVTVGDLRIFTGHPPLTVEDARRILLEDKLELTDQDESLLASVYGPREDGLDGVEQDEGLLASISGHRQKDVERTDKRRHLPVYMSRH